LNKGEQCGPEGRKQGTDSDGIIGEEI